ncbi:riboflavin synthase [Myxococcota bacterium]|nr:riboflavin synthase [Myxococcota bacterium]
MFTGIVETLGEVMAVEQRGDARCFLIRAPEVMDGLRLGDSIAVDGVCLTVTEMESDRFRVDVIPETLERTALGEFSTARRVNLERAMPADGRFDGHIVQGHVDGTGRVRELARVGEDVRLFISCGTAVTDYLVEKGSVTVDGVALTVVGVAEDGFDVALIPHTLAVTTLGERTAGDRVNLEADVLGKYVKRYLDRSRADT